MLLHSLGGAHRLPRSFYARDPRVVARELLGSLLVRQLARGRRRIGRIVETEAYGGRGDRASHAHRGKTSRNAVMFGPPGHTYVYFTYGMHWLLNVVTGSVGEPAAVLIRGIELPDGSPQSGRRRLDGPARLTKALHITGALNDEDLVTSMRLWIARRQPETGRRKPERIVQTPRIGVAYAGRAARWRRRFLLARSVPTSSSHKKGGVSHNAEPPGRKPLSARGALRRAGVLLQVAFGEASPRGYARLLDRRSGASRGWSRESDPPLIQE